MSKPPIDPRDQRKPTEPTWRGIVVAYGTMAAVLVLFAFASYPLLVAATIVATGGLYVASRRSLELYRCVRTCGGFAFDVGDRLQVCVTRPAANC